MVLHRTLNFPETQFHQVLNFQQYEIPNYPSVQSAVRTVLNYLMYQSVQDLNFPEDQSVRESPNYLVDLSSKLGLNCHMEFLNYQVL